MTRPAPIKSPAHLRLVERFPEPAVFVAVDIDPRRKIFRQTRWQKVSGWVRVKLNWNLSLYRWWRRFGTSAPWGRKSF